MPPTGAVRDHGPMAHDASADAHVTAAPPAELDASNVRSLVDLVDGYLRKGARHVVVDLEPVSFMDSSGLGVLVGYRRRSSEEGWRLTLRQPSGQVRRLLVRTNLLPLFDVEDDEQRA